MPQCRHVSLRVGVVRLCGRQNGRQIMDLWVPLSECRERLLDVAGRPCSAGAYPHKHAYCRSVSLNVADVGGRFRGTSIGLTYSMNLETTSFMVR